MVNEVEHWPIKKNYLIFKLLQNQKCMRETIICKNQIILDFGNR